jgi:ribose transport system substrate-binding protein
MVILPLNNAGVQPAVRQARAKNIVVVSLLSSIGPNLSSLQSAVPGVITVGLDLAKNGVDLADLTIKACQGIDPCKVAYMPGDPQQATDQIRTNAYNTELKTASNVHVVSEQAGGFDAGTGLTTSQNILTAHPDLNVLAGASQPIAGAQQALNKAHLTGKVKLIANGGTIQDIQGIRAGTIFGAAVSLPMTEAETGLQLGAEALAGKTVPTATSTSSKSPVGATVTKADLTNGAGASFTGEYSST